MHRRASNCGLLPHISYLIVLVQRHRIHLLLKSIHDFLQRSLDRNTPALAVNGDVGNAGQMLFLNFVNDPTVAKEDIACSLSLAPLASVTCWRGRSTAGPFH